MQIVWLVWRDSDLVGLYASEADAHRRAARLREDDVPAGADRVDAWVVAPPSGLPFFDRARRQHEDVLAAMRERWRLLSLEELDEDQRTRADTFLAVAHKGRLVFPGFQFTDSGELWPGFGTTLNILRDVGWDEFSIAVWFTTAQGSADGAVPAELIKHSPERVQAAAWSTAVDF